MIFMIFTPPDPSPGGFNHGKSLRDANLIFLIHTPLIPPR
jgi:hypothetical protein